MSLRYEKQLEDQIAALEADLAACREELRTAWATAETLTEELCRVRPFLDDLSAFTGSGELLSKMPASVAERLAQVERMEAALNGLVRKEIIDGREYFRCMVCVARGFELSHKRVCPLAALASGT